MDIDGGLFWVNQRTRLPSSKATPLLRYSSARDCGVKPFTESVFRQEPVLLSGKAAAHLQGVFAVLGVRRRRFPLCAGLFGHDGWLPPLRQPLRHGDGLVLRVEVVLVLLCDSSPQMQLLLVGRGLPEQC